MRQSALLLCAACAARAGSPEAIRIAGTSIYPESLTSSADGTLYVGSLAGTIYRALPGQATAEPWIHRTRQNGLLSVFGVLADDRHRTLWVCSSPARLPGGVPTGSAAVVRFDLTSGARTGIDRLPGARAICDDVALAPDGSAYVADIGQGAIWRSAPGGGPLTAFARARALAGIDGIAFAQDGVLYVDSFTHNQLLRVERRADGSFAGLTPISTSLPLEGPDGLRPIDAERFVLAEGRAGRADEVTVMGNSARIRVLASGLQSPAGVTFVHGMLYVPDGKIGYLFDPRLRGRDPGPFYIHAIPAPSRSQAQGVP